MYIIKWKIFFKFDMFLFDISLRFYSILWPLSPQPIESRTSRRRSAWSQTPLASSLNPARKSWPIWSSWKDNGLCVCPFASPCPGFSWDQCLSSLDFRFGWSSPVTGPRLNCTVILSRCASYVGCRGGPQLLFIADSCRVGNICHEIIHALGMFHEHARKDRNRYISINWHNIIRGEFYLGRRFHPTLCGQTRRVKTATCISSCLW